ncbi:MraY family glycosyltransferase [Pedobacter arcticus]|uniref:hypothetical protein n=1 Tax=Pedobacter arcticus TaxID=752140 RepID=UPI0002F48869|nr:hypothetical protein [Pedobacter arcticus]
MQIFIIALFLLFILELLYFKIADRFNIIDKPNQRSSHNQVTLRGGGVVFPIAFIVGILFFQPDQYYLAFGVFAIAFISFLDDIVTLNNKLRIGVHLLSVLLLLAQIFINQGIFSAAIYNPYSLLLILVSLIFFIGIINAYNFMDGINGITVLYSLITVVSCLFIQQYLLIEVLDESVCYLLVASLVVFGFFNLRKKAKAFAGDVGSIAMALIICFLIASLIIITNDIKWILLLGIYGLDSVATICCRIIRKENIFDAHRSHFYQFLANERKYAHVFVAGLYAFFQLVINLSLVALPALFAYLVFLLFCMLYIITRLKLEGKARLFVNY